MRLDSTRRRRQSSWFMSLWQLRCLILAPVLLFVMCSTMVSCGGGGGCSGSYDANGNFEPGVCSTPRSQPRLQPGGFEHLLWYAGSSNAHALAHGQYYSQNDADPDSFAPGHQHRGSSGKSGPVPRAWVFQEKQRQRVHRRHHDRRRHTLDFDQLGFAGAAELVRKWRRLPADKSGLRMRRTSVPAGSPRFLSGLRSSAQLVAELRSMRNADADGHGHAQGRDCRPRDCGKPAALESKACCNGPSMRWSRLPAR